MNGQMNMHIPPLSKINKIIIGLHVGIFLLSSVTNMTIGSPLVGWLGLSLTGLKSGLIYQFFTYPFIETSFMGVLFNSLLVWFIGADLEYKWGQKFYIKFLTFCCLFAALVYLGIALSFDMRGIPLHGLGGATYALLLAYGMIYSERPLTFMLLFPMKAKYFCMLLVGIQLYMGIFSPGGALLAWAQLSAMAFAFAYLKYYSMRARGFSLSKWNSDRKREKMRQKLYIVPEEKDKADPKDPKFWQ